MKLQTFIDFLSQNNVDFHSGQNFESTDTVHPLAIRDLRLTLRQLEYEVSTQNLKNLVAEQGEWATRLSDALSVLFPDLHKSFEVTSRSSTNATIATGDGLFSFTLRYLDIGSRNHLDRSAGLFLSVQCERTDIGPRLVVENNNIDAHATKHGLAVHILYALETLLPEVKNKQSAINSAYSVLSELLEYAYRES